MFDDSFKIYLIEANTNPCLELSSPLLAKLIPQMVENVFKIAIDPIFPPPESYSWKKSMLGEICSENLFELVFDEKIDGSQLLELYKERDNIISKSLMLTYIVEIEDEEDEETLENEDD